MVKDPLKATPTIKRAPRQKPADAATLKFARTIEELDRETGKWRNPETKIALVPTMGALHDGHLALVTKAREIADRTIASIFVNPRQFAIGEDLDTYPRDEAADAKALKAAGVDLVWAPPPNVMYPKDFATHINPAGPAKGLESEARPHFFQGVATVVLKLLNQVAPDFALFGEKDYQQLCVIRQLVTDLDLSVKIVAVPTVREPDGLAMSSRNSYLTPIERARAPALHHILNDLAKTLAERDNPAAQCAAAITQLLAAGFDKVDYVEVRDAQTLGPFDRASGRPGRVLAALWLANTRLIDNVAVPPPGPVG